MVLDNPKSNVVIKVDADYALRILALNLGAFKSMFRILKKAAEKGEITNNEDDLVIGAITTLLVMGLNTSIDIDVEDLYKVASFGRISISIDKFVSLGLCHYGNKNDEYGFPIMEFTEEERKKLIAFREEQGWNKTEV